MQQIRKIAIIAYPGVMLSAVYGLQELFNLADTICQEIQPQFHFTAEIINLAKIDNQGFHTQMYGPSLNYNAIILPPAIQSDFCLSPDGNLLNWLVEQHKLGSILCSACAGTFLLSAAELLQNRAATTHWKLAKTFSEKHPNVLLNIEKILINDGDIITAGGLMSWVDLGLELVAQFSNSTVMRQLGKNLIVDTGLREQRYYQSFLPNWEHGDKVILAIQHFLQSHFCEPISTALLASKFFISERTLLRRFFKATRMRPTEYIQKLRIQKACELLETTSSTLDKIAEKVGYVDIKSFRKIFVKIMGLTPKEFRRRFNSLCEQSKSN